MVATPISFKDTHFTKAPLMIVTTDGSTNQSDSWVVCASINNPEENSISQLSISMRGIGNYDTAFQNVDCGFNFIAVMEP